MTASAIAFTLLAALLVLLLPRRVAGLPVLLAVAYTTRTPVLMFGLANLSPLRVVVLVALIRIGIRGERFAQGVRAIDWLVLSWALLLVSMSAFHTSDAWTFRLGMVLGEVGVYIVCRTFLRDGDDLRSAFKATCLALLPLAGLLLLEKWTAHNWFALMGGPGDANIRDGHVRAYGPFAHAILAGTVGANCVPMAMYLWRTHRLTAMCGLASGLAIVLASTSSSPVMMVLFTCAALSLWRFRAHLATVRWVMVAAIVCLQLVMNDPVYFLMARIDITGSSTGWHRAQLIRSSIEHLDEWWAAGTDYTRHWMPTGIHANEIHTDITNHFLGMGVLGGLPLLFLFIMILVAAFRAIGVALRQTRTGEDAYLAWTVGAMLFGHVVNFWSISLFDQSVSALYLVLAMSAGLGALRVRAGEEKPAAMVSNEFGHVAWRRAAKAPRSVAISPIVRGTVRWSRARASAVPSPRRPGRRS